MIQYFTKSTELGPLKQIPILKQSIKIVRIAYPHNSIHKINSTICKAQNIQQIDLSFNKITSIQPIYELRKLKIINFSNNQIANIGKGILKLKRLEKIDLNFNLLANMSNINTLFELYKIRKTQLTICLQGNKVMQEHKQEIVLRMQQIRQQVKKIKQKIDSKHQLKQLQISKSLDMHKRTHSQPFDLDKSFPKIIPTQNNKHISNIAEAKQQIDNSMVTLGQYERKFQVIAASQFKSWNQTLCKLFKQQSQSVKSLIQTYKNIIKILTVQYTNATQATSKIEIAFIQASELQQLIKDQHCTLLQSLSQFHEVPMVSYKIWVQVYRELRLLAERIRWQAWSLIHCQIRNQQIQALKLISPSKTNLNSIKQKDHLEGLLFSKNKQNQMKQQQIQCSECFIKNQEIRQLKQLVELLTEENAELKQKTQNLSQQNNRLTKTDAILGKQLKQRQEQIIKALDEKIDASVYQKIFLQQAKGIQDLIRCDRHTLLKSKTTFENTQKFGDLCQTATAVAKDKTIGYQKQFVSQFRYQDQQRILGSSAALKRPYFNKNTQNSISQNNKRSKRHTLNSATSTQKKLKNSLQNGHKYDRNQGASNKSRNKTNLQSRKTTEKQAEQYSADKLLKNKQITQNSQTNKQNNRNAGNVVISDFAVTETGKQNLSKQIKQQNKSGRQVLAELVIKKTNQNKIFGNNQKKNKINQEIDEKQKNKHMNQHIRQDVMTQPYIPFDYQSVNLKDQQPYEKYMKYHLRNSIIETLQKKGKRHSLNKQNIKQKTIKLMNRQKPGVQSKDRNSGFEIKYSSRASSDKNFKNTQTLLLNSNRFHSNTKSYGQVLSKLRH